VRPNVTCLGAVEFGWQRIQVETVGQINTLNNKAEGAGKDNTNVIKIAL